MKTVACQNGRVLTVEGRINREALDELEWVTNLLPANAVVAVTMPEVPSAAHQPSSMMTQIIAWVALQTGVPTPLIRGETREAGAVRARTAIVWGATELLGDARSTIAKALRRDPSTISEAVRRGQRLRAKDPAFRTLTERLARHFRETVQ